MRWIPNVLMNCRSQRRGNLQTQQLQRIAELTRSNPRVRGDVDVPIKPIYSGAPDISVTDESMDLGAKDMAGSKRRRAADVAGGKRRLRRQVKTANIDDTSPPAGSSSFEQPHSRGEATAVADVSHPTVVPKDGGASSDGSPKGSGFGLKSDQRLRDSSTTRRSRIRPCQQGYLSDFVVKTGGTCTPSSCAVSEATASMGLERHRKQEVSKEVEEQALSNQLVMLAELEPRRFRTKWQKPSYDGPTNRRDAEADLRNKYLRVLVRYLEENQRSHSHGSAPHRKSPKLGTVWSRTERAKHIAIPGSGASRSFWDGWQQPTDYRFQNAWRHYSEYLQVRLAEPCARGR